MKKKPTIAADECAGRFRATADALQSEGASFEMIVAALVTVAIKAGQNSRLPESTLGAAERAFGMPGE